MTATSNIAYRDFRRRNNIAIKKSRRKAVEERSKRHYVTRNPDLSPVEIETAIRFLDGESPPLTDATRDVLRKHLHAARTTDFHRYRATLARLDAC